ncbi:MAG: ABC transporter ATP-binding protein, partial [Deltaproteobacteria bacterium]|nr:ABC transporter ATP-binding protein [Deltaproteobacteria bacterium]
MDPILIMEKVGFRYGRDWALKGVDIQVRPGELVGIIGPNGSGKSTLLRIGDGVLAPQEGKVILKGRPISSYSRWGLAREVAIVAQESHFPFSFSALEVVLMGRFPHLRRFQFEGALDMKIVFEALKATNCLHLAERPIDKISGGEKQRILIARALAQEPAIILLDEPTSFLDLKYKREMFTLISALAAEKGL